MNYTKAKRTEFEKYSLEPKELAYATLTMNGLSRVDAYMVSHGASPVWDRSYIESESDRVDRKVSKYVSDIKGKEKEELKKSKKDLSKASKENILAELLVVKGTLTPGSKEWLDINKQIIEVNQLKKDEVKTEDTTVHSYVPLKCCQCPLMDEWKRKQTSENRDVGGE